MAAQACTWRSFCLGVLDHAFLLTVIAPLVSMYWCGAFFLVDHYVWPDNHLLSIWFTCLVGFPAVLVCHVIHDTLTRWAHLAEAVYNPLARLYSLLLIVAIVFQWRGLWYVIEYYAGPGYISAAACITFGTILLIAGRCGKSVTGVVPFILVPDNKTNYFSAPSRFAHVSSGNRLLEIADHVYSVVFIHTGIIFLWRGLWHLQDYGIASHNPLLSGTISLASGAGTAAACYVLQWPISACVRRLPWFPRFTVTLLWRATVGAASVFYWRGSWVFFDLAFRKRLFVMWFVTVTAAFSLCVLNCWNLATLRGVYVDDEEIMQDLGEDPILFEVHYFRHIATLLKETRQQNHSHNRSSCDKFLIATEKSAKHPACNHDSKALNARNQLYKPRQTAAVGQALPELSLGKYVVMTTSDDASSFEDPAFQKSHSPSTDQDLDTSLLWVREWKVAPESSV